MYKNIIKIYMYIGNTLLYAVLFSKNSLKLVLQNNQNEHVITNVYKIQITKLVRICDWILENQLKCHIWPIALSWPS